MRNVLSCVSVAAFAIALVAPVVAENRTGKGDAHATCAMACAKRGNQMAILDRDAVYLVEGDYAANSNAKLLDFVARQVEAKGNVVEKDGKMTINVASMAIAK